jgi:hypothetical protein
MAERILQLGKRVWGSEGSRSALENACHARVPASPLSLSTGTSGRNEAVPPSSAARRRSEWRGFQWYHARARWQQSCHRESPAML